MAKKIFWQIALLLLLCLPLWAFAESTSVKAQQKLSASQAQMDTLLKKLEEESQQLNATQSQEKNILGEVEKVDRQLADSQQKQEMLQSKIKQTQRDLSENKKNMRQAEESIRKESRLLAQHVRLLYGMGEEGLIKMVVSGETRARFSQNMHLFMGLIRERNERFRQFKAAVADYRRLVENDKNILQEQKDLAANLAEEVKILSQNKENRGDLLDKVRQERILQEKKIAELKEAREKLSQFMEDIEKQWEAAKKAEEARQAKEEEEHRQAAKEEEERRRNAEKLAAEKQRAAVQASQEKKTKVGALSSEEMNVDLAEEGDSIVTRTSSEKDVEQEQIKYKSGRNSYATKERITARRGSLVNPVRGRTENEQPGLRFLAPDGTPVMAVFKGQVVFANWFRGFGQLVILDHGDNVYTLYGHNQRLLVQRGDWVEEGKTIALVGESGSLDGTGLYFEVRQNGHAVNPKMWLTEKGS